MANLKTARILPGLQSEYTIVALPYWAWFWLDDHVQTNYPRGYKQFLSSLNDKIESEDALADHLETYATVIQSSAMRQIYNLANDNNFFSEEVIKRSKPKRQKKPMHEVKLPAIYKLFGFMPCATTLEAVWERRHYRSAR